MEIPPSPSSSEQDKLKNFEEIFLRYRFWIYAALTISLVFGIYLMISPTPNSLASDPDAIQIEPREPTTDTTAQMVVDVSGGVQNPGVYFLPQNSIVEDGITAAGGFSNRADTNAVARTINRAQLLESHSKIYIPQYGDAPVATIATTTSSATTESVATSKVNINTATTSQLDILPGIGPVTAQRIVDYRIENGDFTSIEDIQNVAGISTAKFDQLKDLITTN